LATTPKPIFVLNGPNLNQLGTREPEIYGDVTLADIETMCQGQAAKLGLSVDFRQSNLEGELVTWIQEAQDSASGTIINAAAYSHTSIALYDALKQLDQPIIEVHLSNIYMREAFRHHSHVSSLADGIICGLGAKGYTLALEAMAGLIQSKG